MNPIGWIKSAFSATIIALSLLLLGLLGRSDAASGTVLYSFKDPGRTGIPGIHPQAQVLVGSDGTLYGSTLYGGSPNVGCDSFGCGAVYSLMPPASSGGPWTENTLYAFVNTTFFEDTYYQETGGASVLVTGLGGALFSTTPVGGDGDSGMIFELTPPATAADSWTTSIIYSFPKGGLNKPGTFAPLLVGSDGTLYGTTEFGGRGGVFKLTPPSILGGSWKETDLYHFAGYPNDGAAPMGGLLALNGKYYGTTNVGGPNGDASSTLFKGLGTVYELTPPSKPNGKWTERVVFAFSDSHETGVYPVGSLVADANGVLYGVAAGGANGYGEIFALTPPGVAGDPWSESIIYSFTGKADGSGPNPGLLFQDGVLYGTASGGGVSSTFNCRNNCGTVFSLTPPATVGGTWTETTVHSFTGPDGAFPESGLTPGPDETFYGTTLYGGTGGIGTVYQIRP